MIRQEKKNAHCIRPCNSHRAAFLEYSFQARIGNMDGVLVAYHNTARIFGFQYISLREMDTCLYGREESGNRVFLRCVSVMHLLYDEIAKCFPDKVPFSLVR